MADMIDGLDMPSFPKLPRLTPPTPETEMVSALTSAMRQVDEFGQALNAWSGDFLDAYSRITAKVGEIEGLRAPETGAGAAEVRKKAISSGLMQAVREILKDEGVLAVEVTEHVVRVYVALSMEQCVLREAIAGRPVVYHLCDASSTIYTARKGVPG